MIPNPKLVPAFEGGLGERPRPAESFLQPTFSLGSFKEGAQRGFERDAQIATPDVRSPPILFYVHDEPRWPREAQFELDENLPGSLSAELAALGHDVDNVRREGLAGHDDPEICAAAQADGRFLIMRDLDFSDVRKFRPGTHHGILAVRLPESRRLAFTSRIVEVFCCENVASWTRSFVVLRPHKLRLLRPT